MLNNKGRAMVAVLATLGVVLLFVVIAIASIWGAYNTGINQEEGIKAQYEQNQNNYDNYFKKVKEVAQVPDMYTGDMAKIYEKVIQGRKGSDQELFRFISEQSPTFDSTLYKQIQQVIESGRDSFSNDQKVLIDKVRAYQVTLRTFPNNMVYGFLGFPKIDMAKYTIVTSEETGEAFKTKKSAPLKLKED
jgi:hypothetical protein